MPFLAAGKYWAVEDSEQRYRMQWTFPEGENLASPDMRDFPERYAGNQDSRPK